MSRRNERQGRVAASSERPLQFLGSRLRLFGVALVCTKVALIPIIFDPASDLPFSVIKGLSSHALAYVLAGVLVGLFAQFGRAVFVRSPLHVPVLAFLVANIAASVVAEDRLLALYGAHDRMIGLGTIADGVLLYFAIAFLVRRRTEGIAVAASFFGGSAVVMTYALVQLVGMDPFSWSVDGAVRPFSTMGQTTNLGLYLAVVAIGALSLAAFDGRLKTPVRVILFLYSGVVLAGVIVTQTRSALIGLLVASVLLVGLTWLGHPSRRARTISVVSAAGAGTALVLILALTPLGARVLSTVEVAVSAEGDGGPGLEESAGVRVALYRIAIEMVLDRPLFGYGPDNFMAALPSYRSPNEPFELQQSATSSAHSWAAQVAATSGLIGLAAYVAIAAVALGFTRKTGFRPAAWAGLGMLGAYLGAGLTTVNAVGTDWLFWATVGAVAAATGPHTPPLAEGSPKRAKSTLSSPRRTRGEVAGLVCVVLGLALALSTASALDASRSAKASQQARLQSRSQQAIELGLRATRADPLRAQYWDVLGLAYVSADRLLQAASAFEQAGKLAPYDFRYSGDLANALVVLTQRGDASSGRRAREVAEHAVRTDPNNPLANHTRAVAMQVTGDLPEALKSVDRALALDKSSNPALFLTRAQVLIGLGRPAEAIVTARQGIAKTNAPDQVPLRIELARALAASRQYADALAEIEVALAIKPNDPTALQMRAQIRAAMTQ